ncbi:MAG: DUF1956 domain-containing protein [Desulfobacteraceae bacterium]|nr:MAG: DUF1956 domain-containing protein [Desulfobacteraceae bacterium]
MAEGSAGSAGTNSTEKNARDRLLEAGLDEFGRNGFDAATTRRIARRAGVNIGLIPYYFDGKQGLYRAVIEHVAGQIESYVAATLAEIRSCPAEKGLTQPEAVALLKQLMGKLIDFMVGSAQAPRFARIILREQLYPSSAYDIIFSRVMEPVIQAIAGTVSAAVGKPVSEVIRLRALSFLGQILIFRVARETVARLLGMQGYTQAETEQIRRIILEQTEAAIRGLCADEGKQ